MPVIVIEFLDLEKYAHSSYRISDLSDESMEGKGSGRAKF